MDAGWSFEAFKVCREDKGAREVVREALDRGTSAGL